MLKVGLFCMMCVVELETKYGIQNSNVLNVQHFLPIDIWHVRSPTTSKKLLKINTLTSSVNYTEHNRKVTFE